MPLTFRVGAGAGRDDVEGRVVGRQCDDVLVPYEDVPCVGAVPGREPEAAANDTDAVRLTVGRSTLVDIGQPISRVSLTKADVADALVTSPSQLLVHGKTPGAISRVTWLPP